MLLDLVKANRSFRGYDESRNVTREELISLVELARISASTANIQPLKYYLVNEKPMLDKLQALTKWAGGLPELGLPYEGQRPTAYIVICHDLNVGTPLARFQKDVGIAAQTMLLGATEIGLGGCMIGNYSSEGVVELLSLAQNLQPVLLVAIGKPAEEVVIVEPETEENVKYFRDENGTHFVPKRKLSDIIIK